jgi:hypothetical protein
VPEPDVDSPAYVKVLVRELDMCEQLLTVEPNCKQALLASALILKEMCAFQAAPSATDDRIAAIFAKLCELDPCRINYYHAVQLK